jgi:hypothetical protein
MASIFFVCSIFAGIPFFTGVNFNYTKGISVNMPFTGHAQSLAISLALITSSIVFLCTGLIAQSLLGTRIVIDRLQAVDKINKGIF